MENETPKLRSDLVIRAEADGEQPVYIVKDPLTGRFYRLRAPEYYLLSRADGETSASDAVRLTNERFGINIPSTMGVAFFEKMDRMLFFENPATEQTLSRLSSQTSFARRSIWLIPLKAFDPDRLVTRWTKRLRFIFNPYSVAVGLALMGVGGAVAAAQSQVWGAGLAEIFSLTSIPLLIAAIMALAFVHEFGHALTLKHYGGGVHEMGFLLLYFQPAFYCNISDSYLLPGRVPRLLVGLAGLFFQGLATAFAIVAWRVLEPGTLLSNFFWVFVAVSLAIFLFNLNPLIKLDGYYILVDWLRMPNLRAKAFAYWRAVIKRWVWGAGPPPREYKLRERRIYRWYGVLAAVYTAGFVGLLIYWVTKWLFAQWGGVGVAIGWGLVLAFAISSKTSSQTQEASAMHSAAPSKDLDRPRRWIKPLFFWGILAVAFAALAIVQAERRVGSPCEVEAGSRFVVTSPVGGTLETMLYEGTDSLGSNMPERRERSILQATLSDFSFIAYNLHVREGDSVGLGDTLVALTSNRYQATLAATEAKRDRIAAERNLLLSGPKQDAIKELRAEIQEATATVQNRETELQRKKMMFERNLIAENEYESARTALEVAKAQRQAKNSKLALLISDPKAEELAIKEAELESLEAEIEFLRTQIAASTVLSPISGEVGRVERGGVLVELADLDPVRLHLLVHENDIADVRVGAPVSLKVRSLPFEEFRGRVARISDLADTLGDGRRFLVTTEMPNEARLLKPGMSGFAKIDCGQRSALALISRQFVQFVRVEFWSWW